MKRLTPEQAKRALVHALLIDLRPIPDYLSLHIRGSVPLLYEAGPGFGSRARDLLPLDADLILLDDGASPLDDAAEKLRGKGFEVAGFVEDALRKWPGGHDLAGTPQVEVTAADRPAFLLDVGDPGVIAPDTARRLPAEHLWQKARDLEAQDEIGILSGFGVRAAAALGILESLGFRNLVMVMTRMHGEVPKMAGPESFRVGGPG